MGNKSLRALKPSGSDFLESTPRTARLPPELCDIVIDFLHDDKPMLSVCSLVCRPWVRAARYHLFDSIYVQCEKDADAFDKFLAYLRSTPGVCAYIKDVCFDGFTEVQDAPDTMAPTYLAAVSALLPQAHTMSLINCRWGPPKLESTTTIHEQPTLKSLYINSFFAEHEVPQHKFRVLEQFSRIERLHLANVWLGHFDIDDNETDLVEQGGDTDSKSTQSPYVEALSMSMSNICLNYLEHLRIQPFMKTLSSLRIVDLFHADYLPEHEDLVYVGQLLQGPLRFSLAGLNFELPRLAHNDTAELFAQVDLSGCTSLTDVHLRMPRRCEAHSFDADSSSQDQGTQVDETTNQPQPQAEQVTAPVQVEQGTQTEPTATWTGSFSKEEWKAPVVLLSRLPLTIKTIDLDVELKGTAEDVLRDLAEGPNWQKLEEALLKLPELTQVSIRRATERPPFVVPWTKAQHDFILRKIPRLYDKKIICLHWP